ncbi:MAG: hypothetical protein LBC53_06630 [Spirochaetaceae bacterium]|jgi:hypothetical protein|nr:hypothetical protein [Spirochaetaceae bacterium]
MSQIENVTQITIGTLKGGRPDWVNYARKQAAAREYTLRRHKAAKKEKRALLDEFTRLAGTAIGNPPSAS